MNYLVFVDARAGELEKILSGLKTMLISECDPAQATARSLSPGDGLYFLRDRGDCAVRVQATVVRALCLANGLEEELPLALKEMQPRLQLTEDQYNYWSAKQRALLVEFESAHKIGVIQVAPSVLANRSGWTAFKELGLIGQEVVSHEQTALAQQSRKGGSNV